MDVSKYLSNEVRKNLKEGIEDAGGNEVFFTGDIDEKGLVVRAKIGSRGTENTVPVNFFDASESSVLIHNHPSGNLKPSDADLAVASKSSQKGQGFYIINNNASDIYVVVEPVLPRKTTKVDAEKAGEYISDGGRLSKISENFEERPVQIELLENIVKTFNENKIAVFEAGTGVGKSFSYLIPSVLWALENNERVVVSTGTISLQQQLCEKDIPFVEKILEKKVKHVLMKGRQNYICRRRLVDAASILDLFEDDAQELKKIAEWAENSATGSKSDLSFMPSENVWTKVNSESDACMGMRCPFHKDCFVMKVRKEAAGANLIVVNHHLLFADIQSRINGSGYDDAAVLPPYRHIVFDEAHGIESAATSFFSESVNKFKIYKLVNPMYRKRKNNASGYLCTIALLSSEEEKAENAHEITVAIKNSLLNVELAAKDLLGDEYTMRLFEGTARNFGPLLVSLNELIKNISLFNDLVMQIMEGVNDDDKEVPAFFEAKIILRRLQDVVCLLKDFIVWDEKRDCVFWVQKKHLSPAMIKEKDDENSDYFTFTQTPLDISKLMSSGVFEQMESVICTSATLKTGRDFNYWMRRTGVNYSERERVLCGEYTSPFPYHKNMLFAVPSDAPLSGSMEFQQYIETALSALIQAAEGRTLVLFTSYESLKSAHKTVSLKLRGFTGRIMKQGDDDNGKLLDAFKKEKESVLFATDSFWQGIDIPGESLSQVIIVKLPFTVPNDPVFVARAEAIEKKGGSSFMELSVPEAVIKYRQGIGRLIRRSDDKGVVVVLDRRIYEKRYGQIFIASMPDCKKVYEPLSEITKKINAFIFE